MKKSLVARGIIGSVASLLGVVAVGCSSEPLSPEEAAEIGVTSQALTAVAAVQPLSAAVAPGGGGITDPVARYGAASCKFKLTINDVLTDLKFVHGGFDGSGNAIDEAYIYNPVANTWTQVEKITDMVGSQFDNQDRGLGLMIPLDDDDATAENRECLYASGTSARANGTALTATFKVTLNSATSVTYTKVGDLAAGRVLGGLMRCGTGTGNNALAIMIGGAAPGASLLGSPITGASAIELWDRANNDWDDANGSSQLAQVVSSFAYAETGSHTKIAIAGGHNGSAAVADVQTFTVDNACTAVTARSVEELGEQATASNVQARFGAIGYFAPGTDDFIVVGGSDGTSNLTYAELFTPTFSATGFARANGDVLTSLTGARFPSRAFDGNQLVAVGGEGPSGNPMNLAPIDVAQEFIYTGGAWTHGTDVTSGVDADFVPVAWSAVEYLGVPSVSADAFYATAGLTAIGPITVTAITQKIQ